LPIPDAEGWSDAEEDIVKDSFIQPSSDPIEEPPQEVDSYNDALTEAIKQTKAISHLPLDEEEEEPSSAPEDSDASSDIESPKPAKVTAKSSKKPSFSSATTKRNGSKPFNQLTFQCMAPRSTHSTSSQNPNHRTIQILDDMCKYYDQMGDNWRTLAYRRGISTLRKQTTKIATKEEAEALPFIGSRLAAKIEEIVLTDRLKRLDSTKDDPTDQILRLFLGIYGVGVSQAGRWLQQGHRTLDDLLQKATLTESQKVGIEHYKDFATRIPRSEVSAHGAYVRAALQKIDRTFQVHVMGSYRRGATDSGDIDLIITKRKTSVAAMREVIFGKLVPRLFTDGFLKVSLATSRRHDDGTGTKWLGASCLPSSTIWRRLDLLLVPEQEMGAALIYFTGNDIFNRSLRLLASKKGMKLNQRGLYKDVTRGKNRERVTEGTLVEGRDEKRIFEVLGVPWRDPSERVC
jgi:DNA polymerase IV